MPSEAPEAPRNSEGAIPVNNAKSTPNEPEAISPEPETSPEIEEKPASQPETAQTPVNEPLENKSKSSLARQLLITARNAIQFRKRKKLDRVMSLFLQHSKITNDEVEKFLHVSDATATRYLSELEKEGKIKQNGKTGHTVSYSRI
jgi:predicted HTH transcriptional regulator